MDELAGPRRARWLRVVVLLVAASGGAIGQGCATSERPPGVDIRLSPASSKSNEATPTSEPSSVSNAAAPAPSETPIGVDLKAILVAPETWVVVHDKPVSSNSLLARMPDDSWLMVDTPMTEAATERLLGWLEEKHGYHRMVVINSHHHLDATGGNWALLRFGAVVHGSRLTASLLEDKGQLMRNELVRAFADDEAIAKELEATTIAPPNQRFALDDGLRLDLGGELVDVIYPGHAHAPDNVIVHLPRRDVLFGGCMIVGMHRLGFVDDADLDGWPAALEIVRGVGASVVVPGHAERFDASLIDHTMGLVEAAR